MRVRKRQRKSSQQRKKQEEKWSKESLRWQGKQTDNENKDHSEDLEGTKKRKEGLWNIDTRFTGRKGRDFLLSLQRRSSIHSVCVHTQDSGQDREDSGDRGIKWRRRDSQQRVNHRGKVMSRMGILMFVWFFLIFPLPLLFLFRLAMKVFVKDLNVIKIESRRCQKRQHERHMKESNG